MYNEKIISTNNRVFEPITLQGFIFIHFHQKVIFLYTIFKVFYPDIMMIKRQR